MKNHSTNNATRYPNLRCLVFLALLLGGFVTSVKGQGGLDQRVSELSQQIANKMTAKQKTTVAVVEFTDLQGNVTDFGRFLAEELVTRLGDLEKFKVIERQLLNKIIAEQKLSLTGVVDPASAKQLGKILGVDAIVSGTFTNLAQSVRVNARLISTETGEVFAVASADIFKDESVSSLLASGGSSSGTAVRSKPQSISSSNVAPQRVKDFVLELQSCKMLGDAVTCYLFVKNDFNEDRRLTVYSGGWDQHTRLYDEFGSEYRAIAAWIGSEGSNGGLVNNLLVSQVRTRVAVKFEKVSAQATKATLSLAIEPPDSRPIAVTFRNIEIVK